MIRKSFAAGILLAAGIALAQPQPDRTDSKKTEPEKPDVKKAESSKLVVKIYELKAILNSPSRPAEIHDMDGIVQFILLNVHLGELKSDGDGPQLVLRSGGRLEIRATEKLHAQVKEVIETLSRLVDIAVDVKADLIELDKEAFEKEVRPLLKPVKGKTDPAAAVGFGTEADTGVGGEKPQPLGAAEKIANAGKLVQTSTVRLANGMESMVSVRQMVFTYRNQAGGNLLVGKEGYQLGGMFMISGDRRTVRVRLTEQSAEVVGTKKRDIGKFLATAPDLAEYGRSATVEVEDDGVILFKLDYAPKDKLWVVMIRPTIFIEAEEAARKKEAKKQ